MIIFNSHKTIETLTQFLPENPIVVEAGAYDGGDTQKMTHRWPQGTIHSFEPLPEIYERLDENTRDYPNIYRYPCALSDKNGTALFYVSEKPTKPGIASQAGSLHKPKDRLSISPLIFPRTAIVETITLQSWAEQNNITHIDLLWLDTQGHELAILQASAEFLKNVHVILTEVYFIEGYEKQPTYDALVHWLTAQGFMLVGKDFEDTTQSFFGNLLFIRSQ